MLLLLLLFEFLEAELFSFLIDSSFSIPYHIDVDSYQTDNFPCTAIMDTIRDRRLPFGKFDDLSD